MNNSEMPSRASNSVFGRQADMIDSGTRIVRVQALTRYKFTGAQPGNRTTSGGTTGQWS